MHKEYHRPLRKQGYFQDVKEGVELLAERKIRSNSATEVGLSYIVNDVNWHDIENFAKWVAETVERISSNERSISPGINFVRFTPTIDYFAHNQYPQHFFDEALHLAYEKAIPLLESVGVQATFFTQRFKNINDTKEYEECLGSSWFAEVSPDGSLYVCCEMNFLPGYWIGDLLRNSIATILESEHRKQVLERLKEGRLRACPVFCKPHTINRIINRIRKAIRHNKESKEIILQWLKDLNSLHEQPSDDFFMKQKTVAF